MTLNSNQQFGISRIAQVLNTTYLITIRKTEHTHFPLLHSTLQQALVFFSTEHKLCYSAFPIEIYITRYCKISIMSSQQVLSISASCSAVVRT